jgi:hypothetical protein
VYWRSAFVFWLAWDHYIGPLPPHDLFIPKVRPSSGEGTRFLLSRTIYYCNGCVHRRSYLGVLRPQPPLPPLRLTPFRPRPPQQLLTRLCRRSAQNTE